MKISEKKMKKWKKSCGLQNYQWKKTTKRKSYLQQPTKPLHFKSNFESIQKFNSNRKAEQETEQESKTHFQTKRNSEPDEDVSLRHSYIQKPEIIKKSKPDIFITENAGFSAYRHHAVLHLSQNMQYFKGKLDICNEYVYIFNEYTCGISNE